MSLQAETLRETRQPMKRKNDGCFSVYPLAGSGREWERKNAFSMEMLMGIMWLLVAVVLVLMALFTNGYASDSEETSFEIKEYIVKGNTLLPYEGITEGLKFYTGQNKTAKDVEEARKYLEGLYHKDGYPTVLVNIPPQEVQEGFVTLEVIESKIGDVRVTGNRYHTKERILGMLPSFRRGNILFVPEVQKEVNKANTGDDLKVTPILMPGSVLGTTDVELKVTDYFPLHGSIELNNRSSHDTSSLRLNGIIHYDNLWQMEHSLTLQYQASPQDTSEVKAFAASYVLPAPWNGDNILAAYWVWSNSQTAFGEGYQMIGKGNVYGIQYAVPLPYYKLYSHSISFGLDYKDMKETQGSVGGEANVKTPVTYLPFNIGYNANLPDSEGTTRFNAGISTAFRSFVTKESEFEQDRYMARSDYLITKLGAEREQTLPKDTSLYVKVDGQLSSQPLINNEQYSAGGMMNVRGYKESEVLGDNALHGTLELRAPDMLKLPGTTKLASYIFSKGSPESRNLTPYIFYDAAMLTIIDPLPGQDKRSSLEGTGLGLRGNLSRYFQFETDYALALKKTDQTKRGDRMLHFFIKGQF
jgi:hemolysin activation/secretion protein